MKKIFVAFNLSMCVAATAQNEGGLWTTDSGSGSRLKSGVSMNIQPEKYAGFTLENKKMLQLLAGAPQEFQLTVAKKAPVIITLPMPDGSVQKFKIVESPIMENELAAKFTNIGTYIALGIDNPHAHGRLDYTEFGFHGMIRTPEGDVFIDPINNSDTKNYISYYSHDFKKNVGEILPEVGVIEGPASTYKVAATNAVAKEVTLRTYRIAVACTGEYAIAATGQAKPTVAQTLAKVVTTINRVSGVFETEVAVRFILVAKNNKILFTDPAKDRFVGNNDATILINESQKVIDDSIGTAGYDIGHTFSTGGGGLATMRSVCSPTLKARGITGSASPVGDPYDIDYVAHEIGHQFGGNHTFSAATGSCAGSNRNAATAVEPGSGVTIMAYAGICQASNNVAPNSIPYFHTVSYDEITAFITGGGNSCAQKTATGNHLPFVKAMKSITIPKGTPFTLSGTAADTTDKEPVTFSWEETDRGASTGANWNSGKGPYFRSYNPSIDSTRTFPKIEVILAGGAMNTTIGEYLPNTAQTLNFRLVARDNKPGGGGVAYADKQVVLASSGPFLLTSQNTTGLSYDEKSKVTVSWSVNKTNQSPVNCKLVNILLSTDGGKKFTTILSNTNNDGSEIITLPAVTATESKCRIKIESVGNIFFDINDKDFSIAKVVVPPVKPSTPAVKRLDESASIKVMPNPFNENVNIVLSGLNESFTTKISVYNLVGELVFTEDLQNVSEVSKNYTLSTIPNGMYLVIVRNGENQIQNRLIKQ